MNERIKEIASKHGVPVGQIEAELKIGIEIEKEHDLTPDERESFALDHIDEIPDYYTRLQKMEREANEEGTLDAAFKKWGKEKKGDKPDESDEEGEEEDEDE